jgi:hypothetical protein
MEGTWEEGKIAEYFCEDIFVRFLPSEDIVSAYVTMAYKLEDGQRRFHSIYAEPEAIKIYPISKKKGED